MVSGKRGKLSDILKSRDTTQRGKQDSPKFSIFLIIPMNDCTEMKTFKMIPNMKRKNNRFTRYIICDI